MNDGSTLRPPACLGSARGAEAAVGQRESSAPADGATAKGKFRQTCDACMAAKTRCSRDKPSCSRCLAQNMTCHYSVSRRLGRPRRLGPPPTAVSPTHTRRPDDTIAVTARPTTGESTSATRQCTVESSGIDSDGDNDRMIIDHTETSNSSSEAVDHERGQNGGGAATKPGQTPVDMPILNIVVSSTPSQPVPALVSGFKDQDSFDSFDYTEPSWVPSLSLSSSLTNDIGTSTNQAIPDDSDVDRPPSCLHNFGLQMDHAHFSFSPSEHEVDVTGAFGSEFLADAVPSVRETPCRCLESALGVRLSIEQAPQFPYPGAIGLALDVEVQLRETVPLAVQCQKCQPRRAEILKLFADAMADIIELLQQLCNVEFVDMFDSQRQHALSTVDDSLAWLQPKSDGRALPDLGELTRHNRNTSWPLLHQNPGSNGSSFTWRTSSKSVSNNETVRKNPQKAYSTTRTDFSDLQNAYSSDLGGWSVLVGRHLILGDDRKFVLIHLLRRRLGALSQVLEDLIRGMQDLRMALRREEPFGPDSHTASRAVEIDTRKPMKAVSKLYDVIDKLDKIQV